MELRLVGTVQRRESNFHREIRNLTAGGSGSKYVKMQMLMPRGTSAEGATHLTFCANIYWKKVDNVDFGVAFVFEDQDAKTRTLNLEVLLMHRQIKQGLQRLVPSCRCCTNA